jgi:hypothetical protein
MLLQFKQLRLVHPICFAKIQRLVSQAPVPMHVVSWEPQVVSISPLVDTEQCAGKFFDSSFSFDHWYCFQRICFHFKFHCFLISQWSLGGGANDTTNHFTMISVLGGGIWKES